MKAADSSHMRTWGSHGRRTLYNVAEIFLDNTSSQPVILQSDDLPFHAATPVPASIVVPEVF
jgi:hypothetical protein